MAASNGLIGGGGISPLIGLILMSVPLSGLRADTLSGSAATRETLRQ
jgi:hypothetical protein